MIVETDLRKKTERLTFIGVSGFLMRTTDPTQEAFPVKRISSNQSRVNSARRKRKVRARHGQAGHWNARRQPMFNAARCTMRLGRTRTR